ncbi:hypothetical protein PL81_37215, partial [Streptomyces sp. RSD-27]
MSVGSGFGLPGLVFVGVGRAVPEVSDEGFPDPVGRTVDPPPEPFCEGVAVGAEALPLGPGCADPLGLAPGGAVFAAPAGA